MSAGADPVRVYWYWRRTLLDPTTDPEQAVAASTIIAQMERWYPAMSRSRPPKDEQTGADLSNPWDFLTTTSIPGSFQQEQMSRNRGEPVNWRRGLVGWVFSPEVPGRYGLVLGVTDTKVCIIVSDDPRIPPDGNMWAAQGDASLHIWVDRGAIHAPEVWYSYVNGFEKARTIKEENTVSYPGSSMNGPFGRRY